MSVSVEREEEEGSRLERLSSRDGGEERREGEEGEGFEGGCRACTCKLCVIRDVSLCRAQARSTHELRVLAR